MSQIFRQKDLENALSVFQLSHREIEVFYVLLRKDAATASEIARGVPKIPRTSVYDLLHNLQEFGLVSVFQKGAHTYYKAGSAEHIVDVLEDKKRVLSKKQDALRNVSDIFQQIRSGTAYRPGIRFFEGRKGILAITRELQDALKPLRTIANMAAVKKEFSDIDRKDDIEDFQKYRIPRRALFVHNQEAEEYLKISPVSEIHRVKWLPVSMKLETDTLCWEGHVAIIDYAQNVNYYR